MIKEMMFIGLIGISPLNNDADSGKSFAYKGLARDYIKCGDYGGAFIYIKKGLEHGNEEEYYELLGSYYSAIDDNRKALNEFLKHTVKFPNDANGFNNVACSYVKLNEFEKASRIFELAISMEPKNEKFYFNAASNYLGLFAKNKKKEDLILSISYFIYSDYFGKEEGIEKAINTYELGINKRIRDWDEEEFKRWDDFRSEAIRYLEELFIKKLKLK